MLLINNQEVEKLFTMKDCLAALEDGYDDLLKGDAVYRPRLDLWMPCDRPDGVHFRIHFHFPFRGQYTAIERVEDGVMLSNIYNLDIILASLSTELSEEAPIAAKAPEIEVEGFMMVPTPDQSSLRASTQSGWLRTMLPPI